ncbi:MAG: hydrogenase iron-sulfur subunit [Deltaproteobacteria bacterium]|nr:hydrogenase iron-sulfur subunit [Deltaproteobacteria bacterium]
MKKKCGIYICSGCGIDAAVDTQALIKVAEKELKAEACHVHPFLCDDSGLELIKSDLRAGTVDHFVVAACSQRFHQQSFDMGPEHMVLRAPIREYVAWMMEPRDENGKVNEDTQMAAADYIRMYGARVKRMEIPQPFEQDTIKSVLVIGGGITGINAALEVSKAGYPVHLVEKQAELGGAAKEYRSFLPQKAPYRDLEDNQLEELISRLKSKSDISLYPSSTVDAIDGEPGNFTVRIKNGQSQKTVAIGSVILATGGKSYDKNKLTHLGAQFKNVVSSDEFEAMAKTGKLTRQDGSPAKTIAFIQCAGSRDKNHLSYCSSTCCMNSLKQAAYVRQIDPETKAYILYRDMRTPGLYENFYKKQQDDPGIFLTKGEIAQVSEDGERSILIDLDNSLLGDQIQLKADLLVLATGQVSSLVDEESHLNLGYRQGKDLPDLNHGYPDSHFICFPYETRRTGIFSAGPVRHPMDINEAKRDAAGAALKAVQTLELTSMGKSMHPRVGDLSKPDFYLARCTSCKRCTEECPFGMLDEDEKGTPRPNPARCRSCGTCMGACPERIISFADYSIQQISDMIKEVEIPDEFEEKPRILIFACENDSLPAFDMAALNRIRINPYIRIIPVRCLGGINLVFVSDALSVGFDGVMFMGCKFGDDYQCHFVKGSELCNERLSKVQETISRLNLESERIRQFTVTLNDYDKLPEIINDFVTEIDAFGPNPFKGM